MIWIAILILPILGGSLSGLADSRIACSIWSFSAAIFNIAIFTVGFIYVGDIKNDPLWPIAIIVMSAASIILAFMSAWTTWSIASSRRNPS